MGEIATIGLDLAKNVFQVHGVDAEGKVLARCKLRRVEVLEFFAVSCSSCHHAFVPSCGVVRLPS